MKKRPAGKNSADRQAKQSVFQTFLKKQRKQAEERQKKKLALSTQASIPYKAMYRDGICRTDDGRFSKTVKFYDINYQLAQADDKPQFLKPGVIS